jgi:hypothetical protein
MATKAGGRGRPWPLTPRPPPHEWGGGALLPPGDSHGPGVRAVAVTLHCRSCPLWAAPPPARPFRLSLAPRPPQHPARVVSYYDSAQDWVDGMGLQTLFATVSSRMHGATPDRPSAPLRVSGPRPGQLSSLSSQIRTIRAGGGLSCARLPCGDCPRIPRQAAPACRPARNPGAVPTLVQNRFHSQVIGKSSGLR